MLPAPALAEIASFLDVNSLYRFCEVNRTLHATANSEHLWRARIQRAYPDHRIYVARSTISIQNPSKTITTSFSVLDRKTMWKRAMQYMLKAQK